MDADVGMDPKPPKRSFDANNNCFDNNDILGLSDWTAGLDLSLLFDDLPSKI